MSIADLERFSPGGWFWDVSDQLIRHVYTRSQAAFAAGDRVRDGIATAEQLLDYQRRLREFFVASLGGLPSSEGPLNARTVGTVPGDGFTVERVVFESRPGNFVTANLYLPDNLSGPSAAVQFVCGHHRDAKHQPEYQIVCQYLVQAGLIVLAQDPIGQGERFGYWEAGERKTSVDWGTTEHDHVGSQCWPLGDGLARYFLHDAMRGIDYLRTRPEVDPARIGVTGNSGGGTQTSLMMLADPRVAAAAPATFITGREIYQKAGGPQDAEQIWPGFSQAGYDHEDILLALCPKPVCVLAVTSDFFPIEGTRRTVARARRLWKALHHPDRLVLVEDESEHRYTENLARAAARFFARHLRGESDVLLDDARIRPFPPEALWCTRSGQVRGEIPGAVSVYEANQERREEARRRREALAPEEARAWLRERVLTPRTPCDLNPRFMRESRFDDLAVTGALWRSQEDLFNFGYLFRPDGVVGDLPATIALWDGGTRQLHAHLDWLRASVAGGRAVLVLDVAGMGALSPRLLNDAPVDGLFGTLHKMATDLLFLGDDLASLRTFDVLRAREMLAVWPGVDAGDVQIYAAGRMGVYGRLAARIGEGFGPVTVAEGSFAGWDDWVSQRHYPIGGITQIVVHGILAHAH